MIFIAILLVIAFFIYGLFSPSGASKLWYNIRTFSNRIMSRFSNESFVNYDTYKLNIPSIWSKDKSDLNNSSDLDSDLNSNSEISIIDSYDEIDSNETEINDKFLEKNENDIGIEISEDNQNNKIKEKDSSNKNVVKSFWNISPLKFVNMKEKLSNESKIKQDVSWYSKSDLLWIISNYIEANLKDDTDILVTIEYSESWEADKIILKTQPKYKSTDNVLSIPRLSLEKMIDWIYKSRYETVIVDSDTSESIEIKDISDSEDTKEEKNDKDSALSSKNDSNINNDLVVEVEWKKEEKKENTPVAQKTTQKTIQKTIQTQARKKTTNGLSQKDIREAEEVIWALF